jgi:hypothetical protein
MQHFTATFIWTDLDDPRFRDEWSIDTVLGPDGRPPTVIRLPADVDGEAVFDVYHQDGYFELPDEVPYRYIETIPREPDDVTEQRG